ncbi:transposase [Cutibacterium sp.]|uniref:transposase n=1 Tax=Cutibacterium sp. TaxID=1912221 RepID=UPI0034C61F7E
MRAGRQRLTPRQRIRLAEAFAAHRDHISLEVAYQCAQDIPDVFGQPTPAQGRRLAQRLIDSLPACPIPEIARLGRTLRRWKTAFLPYFDTNSASTGSTQTTNGIIELGRRIATGFRNRHNYRLRILLNGGGLNITTPT